LGILKVVIPIRGGRRAFTWEEFMMINGFLPSRSGLLGDLARGWRKI